MKIVTGAVGLAVMRQRVGLSQNQLATTLGLQDAQVAGLETGEISAAPSLRLILMRYFECQFADLFEVLEVNPDDKTV